MTYKTFYKLQTNDLALLLQLCKVLVSMLQRIQDMPPV